MFVVYSPKNGFLGKFFFFRGEIGDCLFWVCVYDKRHVPKCFRVWGLKKELFIFSDVFPRGDIHHLGVCGCIPYFLGHSLHQKNRGLQPAQVGVTQ